MLLVAFMALMGGLAPQSTPADLPSVNLEEVHGSTLLVESGSPGVPWTTDLDDVWRLRSFRYEFPDRIELETGAATLVIGKRSGDPDRRGALWAVLLPDEPVPRAPLASGRRAGRIREG